MSPTILGRLGRQLPLLVLVFCVGVTCIGLTNSSVLGETLWLPALAQQTMLLFATVAISTLVASLVAIRLQRRPELALGLVLLVVGASLCGTAPVLVVLFFLLSSWVVGTIALTGVGRRQNDLPAVVTLAVGWAMYALAFSVLASIPVNTAATHTVILSAPIMLALVLPRLRNELRSSLVWLSGRASQDGPIQPVYLIGLIVCVTILSLHLAMVALPERYFDAMAMHLYIPSYISAHRAWSYDANNYAFAFMPAGADMLYAHMFLIGGEGASRILNFSAFLFTCIATLQISMRATSRAGAAWAAALLVSLPLTLIESATLFVENTVALFITTAVLVLTQGRSKFGLAHFDAIVVLMAGASVVKLHGLIAAAPIGAIAFVLYAPQLTSPRRRIIVAMLCIAGAAIASWPYAYAWVKTGNPVLPLFNHLFKSPYFPPIEFVDSRWIGKLSASVLYDATFYTTGFVEAYGGALGFGFLVFLAAGFAAVLIDRNRIGWLCGGLGFGLIALLSIKSQYLRYLLIFFPLLTVVVAVALGHLAQFRWLRLPLATLTAVVIALNVYKMPAGGWILGVSDLRACCSSNIRRDLEMTQAPERVVNRIVNDAAGPMSRVLYIDNPYGGLLTGTAIYTAWYNTKHAADFAAVSNVENFAGLMAQIAPTHVVLDTTGQRPLDKLAAAYLQSKATLLTQVGRLALYRL